MRQLTTTVFASANGASAQRTRCLTVLPGQAVEPLPEIAFAVVCNRLTARECDVLSLVSAGAANAEIARRLLVSQATVRAHLKNIRDKLGFQRSEEVLLAAAGCAGLFFDDV